MIILQKKSVIPAVYYLAALIFLFSVSMPKAFAGNYLGEFCWLFQQTDDAHGQRLEDPLLMKLGITHMGDSYFTSQGIIETPPGYAPVIINGSLIIIGQEIFMTMNTSHNPHPSPKPDTFTIQMRLDSSLNGTFWGVGLEFNTLTREFDQGYIAGTATHTICP